MRLATVTFFVVPCSDPVVSDTSVTGIISATSGVAPRAVKSEIFLFAIVIFL
jgi:hypothetical protein